MDLLVVLIQDTPLESEFTALYHYRITTQYISSPALLSPSIAEGQLLD